MKLFKKKTRKNVKLNLVLVLSSNLKFSNLYLGDVFETKLSNSTKAKTRRRDRWLSILEQRYKSNDKNSTTLFPAEKQTKTVSEIASSH